MDVQRPRWRIWSRSPAAVLATLAFSLVLIMMLFISSGTSAEQEDAVLIWNQKSYDLEVIDVRDPVTFNLAVKVTSDKEMVSALYQVEGPIGWTNIFFSGETEWYFGFWPEFWYIPDKVYQLNITITPPVGALNATHWFTVRVHLEENISASDSTDIGIVVKQYADFELVLENQPPSSEFRARPQECITIRIALFNTGNGYDRFIIRSSLSRENSRLLIEFINGVDKDGNTPILPPDPFKKRPYYIEVKVTIAPEELAGMTTQVTINATSMFNRSLKRPPVFFSITSLQYFDFQVYTNDPDFWPILPGYEVEFQLKINNSGNGWDTFTIRPIWDSELNPGFIASANPRTIDIGAGMKGTVLFIVKVPETVAIGTYFFTAEIKSSSPELAPVTKFFAVDVGQYYRINMYSLDPTVVQTIPGGNLEFEVTVHNTGNGLDSIVIKDIIGAPPGWLTYTEPPEVILLQDQEATVKIIVIVPSHFEEAPIGLYNLTLPATSSRSDARAEFYLEIEITQFTRIEWLYQDVRPDRAFNPYERNHITITEQIKNYGNGRDTVTLEWYSPDPRIALSFNHPTIQLDSYETRHIMVNITVMTDIPPGDYVVHVNATSDTPGSIPRMLSIDIRIDNMDALVPPIPTFIDPTGYIPWPLEVPKGENLSSKLKVENNGTRPLQGVRVKVFDIYWVDDKEVRWNFFNFTTPTIDVGDRFIVGERPFTPGNPPLYWWANRTGNHTLEFWVYYPHQSNTENDVSRLNVMVVDYPDTKGEEGGFRLPPIRWVIIGILFAVLASTTAVGLHEWIKELKKPLRPW